MLIFQQSMCKGSLNYFEISFQGSRESIIKCLLGTGYIRYDQMEIHYGDELEECGPCRFISNEIRFVLAKADNKSFFQPTLFLPKSIYNL